MSISLFINAQNLVISDDSTFSGTTNNALMEVYSSDSSKGILIPRLTSQQRTDIGTLIEDEGLVVYDIDTHTFWVWNGGQWVELGDKQTLYYDSNTGELTILNGNSVTITDNDNQNLSLSGDNLSITGGNTVDLSGIDNQTLSISGHTLSIDNGNSVTLPDNQTLSISGTYLIISGGNYVDMEPAFTSSVWGLNGNSITSNKFLGTTNDQPLNIHTNNILHVKITQKGQIETYNTGGSVFIGEDAGDSDDHSDNYNVFIGYHSGKSNTTGSYNCALGYSALENNVSGITNTALGGYSMQNNTTGYHNTAIGYGTLSQNTTGYNNTAIGNMSMEYNTTGHDNTAIGYWSLYYNSDAEANTAIGESTMFYNTTGSYNTTIGFNALKSNTTGNSNTSLGYDALYNNKTGSYNTAIGYESGNTNDNFDNSTGIGYNAQPDGSNKVFIGNSSVTWIGGQVGWSTYSDKRIKTNIKDDVKGLEFILRLRPVTYNIDKDKEDKLLGIIDNANYKKKYDIEKIKFSGFLAQEVEKAAIESGYDFSGVTKPVGNSKLYSLSYAQFVVPLVKAVQEQEQKIENQQKIIETLKDENKQQQTQIEQLKKQNEEILKRLNNLGNK